MPVLLAGGWILITSLAGCQPNEGGDGGPESNHNGNANTNDNASQDTNSNDNGIVVPPGDGVCEGQICGPSGGFAVAEFPTIAEVDFGAFPENPARPYQPREGRRFWYVATDGDDNAAGTQDAPLAAPAAALARAATGDVILVGDGEYVIGAEEYNALTMAVPGVTLAAENIGQVRFRPPAGTDIVAVGIAAVADDVVVDGFIIEGFRNFGVLFGRVSSPQRNCVLKHLVIDGAEDGVRAEVADVTPNPTPIVEGLLLYDVWLRHVRVVGINCGEGPCNDVRLEALRVEMQDTGGGSGSDAVGFENGDNIVVFNVEATGAAADGLDFKCTRVAIANAWVHDVARNGIKLWHGGDVINALVDHTGADAAIVGKVGRFRLLNSLVAFHAVNEGEAYAATFGYDDPDTPVQLDVINTIFYQNTGPLWASPAADLDVRNSIFYHSPYAAIAWRELYVSDDGDSFSALEAAGGGSDNPGMIDPAFTDPADRDFALAADSPARDRGTTNVGAFVDFDLRGGPRVTGGGVDLGPLEGE